MERNKPFIDRDSAYSAESITTPVKSLSILLASSSQFRFRTFQRTRAGFRCMTATWDREAFGDVSFCHCIFERFTYLRTDFPGRQKLK